MKYIIETPSAARYGNCVIGEGDTPAEAWANAYGPKPWAPSTKRFAKNAWVRQVTDDELNEIHYSAH
jgi:hypothetical protein